MASKQEPVTGLNYGWEQGESGWNTGMDDNLRLLGAIVQIGVLSATETEPSQAYEGARYIVPENPTGAFADQVGKLAVYRDGEWQFLSPVQGWQVKVSDTGRSIWSTGSDWIEDETPRTYSTALPASIASNPGGWQLPARAWTQIPLYSPTENVGNGMDNGTFTAPEQGLYLATGTAKPSDAGTAPIDAGVDWALGIGPTAAAGAGVVWGQTGSGVTAASLSRVMRLSAGDTLMLFSYQEGVGGCTFDYAEFSVTKIRE